MGSALLSSFLAFGAMKRFDTWTVLIGFIGVGASATIMDCSNNSLAQTLEVSMNDHFNGALQACGSLGIFVGVLAAGWAFSLGITIVNYSFFLGFAGMAISSIFFIHDVIDDKNIEKNRSKDNVDNDDKDDHFKKSVDSCKLKNYPSYPVSVGPDAQKHSESILWAKFYCICAIGFFNIVSVGSVNNWSTTYSVDVLGTSPAFTSVAYAGYMFCYIFGQLLSDRTAKHFGVQKLLIGSALIACVGLSVVVFAPSNPFLFEETCHTSASCLVCKFKRLCIAVVYYFCR